MAMATAGGVRVGDALWVEVEDRDFQQGDLWLPSKVVGLHPDGSIETTAGRRCDEEVRIQVRRVSRVLAPLGFNWVAKTASWTGEPSLPRAGGMLAAARAGRCRFFYHL